MTRRPISERLAERLAPSSTHSFNGTPCQEWQGCSDKDGYGFLRVDGKNVKTHRIAYQLAHGAIPNRLAVLHHCDNPPCCAVAHLYAGTLKDNSRDMIARGRSVTHTNGNERKTHCPQGHPYHGDNLFVNKKGRRICRLCMQTACRRAWQKRHENDAFVAYLAELFCQAINGYRPAFFAACEWLGIDP